MMGTLKTRPPCHYYYIICNLTLFIHSCFLKHWTNFEMVLRPHTNKKDPGFMYEKLKFSDMRSISCWKTVKQPTPLKPQKESRQQLIFDLWRLNPKYASVWSSMLVGEILSSLGTMFCPLQCVLKFLVHIPEKSTFVSTHREATHKIRKIAIDPFISEEK